LGASKVVAAFVASAVLGGEREDVESVAERV